MAIPHGKGTKVVIDIRDLSAYFNNTDSGNVMDLAESTTYGAAIKTYIAGLKDADFSISGLFDNAQFGGGDTESLDSVLSTAFGLETTLVTVGLDGLIVGSRVLSARIAETEYSISSPVGDIVTVDVAMKPSAQEPGRTGVSLHPIATPVSATGPDASVDYGPAPVGPSTPNGGVGFLHVVQNSRNAGGTVIKIQHSTDDAAWADLITFATVGTVRTAERLTVAGTINRYLRANVTAIGGATGTLQFAATFVRG